MLKVYLFLAIFGSLTLNAKVFGPKYGPDKTPRAVPLSRDHSYFQQKPEMIDFWWIEHQNPVVPVL